jgi:hypothetical protein
MSDARAIYAELFKLAAASQEVGLVKEAAVNKWLAGGLLGAGGLGAYALGRGTGAADARKKLESERISPALAFGGGLTAGLVGPSLLRSAGHALGLTPGGEEFTSI